MIDVNIEQKVFGKQIVLQDVTFSISENGIYGLVGKNGEGKTTLFRCLMGLEKYNGSCTIDNHESSLQSIAWCPAEPFVYEELTAAEFYTFYSELLDLPKSNSKQLFDLPKDKLIREFSTGMKKKTYLNAVFQKDYDVYLLDEPFNGLDIESNYILMNFLRHKSQNSTILISSHIMEILYANCQEIYVVNNKNVSVFEKLNFGEIEKLLF